MAAQLDRLRFEGTEYEVASLDPAEMAILKKHVMKYMSGESSLLTRLFEDNWDAIVAAAGVAKSELKRVFNGMYASDNEIGVQLIRPTHILRSTAATEAAVNDWTVTLTADGDYWIGFDTNNTTAINIDKRIGAILWLGVVFTQGGNPTVEELLPQLDGVNYPVQVIRHAWWADNTHDLRVARIRPIIAKAGSTLLVQTYSILAQQQEMVAVGLTFATGAYMRLQAPTVIQV